MAILLGFLLSLVLLVYGIYLISLEENRQNEFWEKQRALEERVKFSYSAEVIRPALLELVAKWGELSNPTKPTIEHRDLIQQAFTSMNKSFSGQYTASALRKDLAFRQRVPKLAHEGAQKEFSDIMVIGDKRRPPKISTRH